ncbi:MAG TPA: lipid II flippase MurJ [Candidatus Kryptonia bacterium]
MIFFLNAINLLTVLVGFVVQIIIVRYFGASDSTDIYYLVITITTFVTGLSTGFLTDLFVPIYHDAKNRGAEDARNLSGSILTLSLISGVVISALVYVLAPVFISIFASGFQTAKFGLAVDMLRIISLSIAFATISMVLNSTLNANSFFLITYLTNLITPTFNILGLLIGGSRFGVAALMYATLISSITIFLVLFLYCKIKVGARFVNPVRQKDLNFLLVKNIPVRAANMIQLLRGPLTTSILSYFPAGMLTLYSYAEKIINVLMGTTNSPLAQVYYTKSSKLASKKDYSEIRSLLVHIVRSSVVLFAGTFFVVVIVFQNVFNVLFSGRVPPDGVHTMFLLFMALFPYYYAMLIGTSLGATGLAMKKGRLTLYAAILFVSLLAIAIYPSVRVFSLYGLPISLAFAQVIATILYAVLVNRIETLIDFEVLKIQGSTIVLSLAMIAFNFLTGGNLTLQVSADAAIFLAWLILNWSSAVNAMQLITSKGEVK